MSTVPTELARMSDFAHYWAERRPRHEALVMGSERITYAALSGQVRALAKALLAHGVTKGDRVAMLVSGRPAFYVALLATAEIGAIWLGLHPRYRLPELRHVMRESRPKVLLAFSAIDGRGYASELRALAGEVDSVEHLVVYDDPFDGSVGIAAFLAAGSRVSDEQWQAARGAVQGRDTAVIIFTSGTTGAPKGAMISHTGLIRGGRTQSEHWPGASMRLLQAMPPNHIACIGMSTAHALMSGGTVIFLERITFFPHSPAVFHMLAEESGLAERDLGSLEYLIWAGAPMMPNLIGRLRGLGAKLGTAFGMTELGAYVCYSDADADPATLATTIGRPDPHHELRLADAQGRPVARGAEGEIQARGEWLMNGYFNHETLTRAAYTADGWFRTGDVAVEESDGSWRLVGRLKEMFKSGGYNVYPREVELAIESHPEVAMAAVIGVPDERWHEVGYAFAQPRAGVVLDPGALGRWCRERLANYKVPKTIEVVAELPRLAIGKIDKQALRRRLE